MPKHSTDAELLAQLKMLVEEHKASYTRLLRSKMYRDQYGPLLDFVLRKTPLLASPEYTLVTRVYWVLHGIESFNDKRCCCKNCTKNGEHRNVKNIFFGYNECCSKKCMHDSTQRKERYKQTCLERFGCENASQSQEIKDKKVKSMLERFGVENPAQSDIVKQRTQQTNLERYNTEFTFQAKSVKEKSRKTLLAHFGVENPSQSSEIRAKACKRYKFNDVSFDSKPELALYIYLLDNKIPFEYQPDISFKYEHEDKTFYYFPDFRIDGVLCEIKGRHFFKADGTMQNPWCHEQDGIYEAKHQCMLANGVKILLDNDELVQKAISFVEGKYGTKYLSTLRKEMP